MVLDDHVMKGKKLLPPMVAKGYPIELGNWPLDRIPEFFWIAFMVERLGRRETLNLVTRMSKSIHLAINKIRGTSMVIRPYLLSEHLKFSDSEQKNIFSTSRRSKWFQAISPLIAELLIVWPKLPAGYLTSDESEGNKAELADEIKDILVRFSHRHDELAVVVQAIVALAEIRSGHVSKPTDLEWPNFDAVIDDPKSAEADHAAGFAVVTCGQLNAFGRESPDFVWNRNFWNSCYRLQPCEHEYE